VGKLQAVRWLGASALVALLFAAAPATAAAALKTTPDATYQANGRVSAILTIGNVVYIGGRFTSVRPAGASPGVREIPRAHLAAFDASTGEVLPWNPAPDRAVFALARSANGRTVFVGGSFGHIAGAVRHRFAALTAAARQPAATASGWGDMNVAAPVTAIAATASRVYIGGDFHSVAGAARRQLAAFDTPAATGGAAALDRSWTPTVSDASGSAKYKNAQVLALTVDGSRIFVGGAFETLDGFSGHRNLDALDLGTGRVSRWTYHPAYQVYQVTVTPQLVYAGGDGPGGTVEGIGRSSARPSWGMRTDGGIQGFALLGGLLYVGGHFDNVCNGIRPGGPPYQCVNSMATEHKIFAVDATTGHLDRWYAGADSPLGLFAMATLTDPRTGMQRLEIGGDFARTGNPSPDAHAQHRQESYAQYSPVGAPPLGGPPRITAPASGAALRLGTSTRLAVDFGGAGQGAYAIAVSGPSFRWSASYRFDGSPQTASWTLPRLTAIGRYSVSVSGPTGRAVSAFIVDGTVALLQTRLSSAEIFPYELDGHLDRLAVSAGATGTAVLRATIRNTRGRIVRHLSLGRVAPGRHAIRWAGRNDRGVLVAPGGYRVRVSATAGGRAVRGRPFAVAVRLLPLRIFGTQVEPARMRPGARLRVDFRLSKDASAHLEIRRNGRLVRRLRPHRLAGKTRVALVWRGTDRRGRAMPPKTYRVRVVATFAMQRTASRWSSVTLVR
jgi:hypothetical protein